VFKQYRLAFLNKKKTDLGLCDRKDIKMHKFTIPHTVTNLLEQGKANYMVSQNQYVEEAYPHAPSIIKTEDFLIKNSLDFICRDDIPYEIARVDYTQVF